MRVKTLFSLILVTVPVTVSACEGDCIVGITNAFIGNYTDRVRQVWTNAANEISPMLPGNPGPDAVMNYLTPITNAYHHDAYDKMENAIFPSYFHGKCQQDGVNPPGCPNPDCPVVCGTPGSLVHFYSKLRYIAFNQTKSLLHELSAPGSNTYQEFERNILEANGKTRRSIRIYARATAYGTVPLFLMKREEDLKAKLRQTMAKVDNWLEQVCGGNGAGTTNHLPECSWENNMKQYILSFP